MAINTPIRMTIVGANAPNISTPADYNYASPQIVVDIYNASDSITITGSNAGIIRADIRKSIRSRDPGSFRLQLAPGGPNGPGSTSPTWTQVIVPFSLAVISLKRGTSNAIVMVGLITAVREAQEWKKGAPVQRVIEIVGDDFFTYYSTFAYYVLSFLGLLDTLPELFGPAANVGGKDVLSGLNGRPDQVGDYWFKNVLMGSDAGDAKDSSGKSHPGAMSHTYLNYKGTKSKIRNFFGSWFQQYTDGITANVLIPMSIDFLISQGDFLSKFTQIFPFPFYEFFTITAPRVLSNGELLYPSATQPATFFQSSDSTVPPAGVYTIARVNPLPWVVLTPGPAQTGGLTSQISKAPVKYVDSLWSALPTYDFTKSSFIVSDVNYNLNEVRNFYIISPMSPLTMTGMDLSSIQGAIEQFGYAMDFRSMTRYGYRPEVETLLWWTDPLNTAATAGADAAASGVTPEQASMAPGAAQAAAAYGKVASYFEPTPLMLSGYMTIPMWPEVVPGNRFRCIPFKGTEVYLFYIEGVNHTFEFGGTCVTTLSLTRGLPEKIYTGNTNIIAQMHLGAVDKINGVYTIVAPTANTTNAELLPLVYATLNDTDITAANFGVPYNIPNPIRNA